jgi:hypothetical protein
LIHRKRLLITGGLGDLRSWFTGYGLKKFDVNVLTREKRDVSNHRNYKLALVNLADELRSYAPDFLSRFWLVHLVVRVKYNSCFMVRVVEFFENKLVRY